MKGSAKILAAVLPAIAAIAVFGSLYGAAARPVLGAPLTLAASLLVFSGSLQFAIVALAAAGAPAGALLLTAATLNLRHLVMGAVLRPRLTGSRLRRAALAFFLLDETLGFAVAAAEEAEAQGGDPRPEAERTLLVSGVLCYAAWGAGTVVGLLGAGNPAVAGVAGAIFPVLFIGLASLASRTLPDALRALAAAFLTVAFALAAPEWRALAPAIACVAVSLPGRAR